MTAPLQRRIALTALVGAAVLVWLQDLTWTANMADTLPLAAGIPLAWWLGGPWKPREALDWKIRNRAIAAGLVGFLCGWLLSSLTLLAISWTLCAGCLIGVIYQPRLGRTRLACLLLLSFPWIALEWPQTGWWFRLSSAWAAEHFFHLLAMPVVREGTHLNVMGVPIDIEPGCAGWNLLQLTLLTGVTLGSHELPSSGRFKVLFCLLPVLSWGANLFRILLLSGLALSFDVDVASGALHGMTGLGVIALVVVMTKILCFWLAPPLRSQSTIVSAS